MANRKPSGSINPRMKQKSSVPGGDPATSKLNFLFEHFTLMAMTIFACLGAALWIVAIATDYWIILISTAPDRDFAHSNLGANEDLSSSAPHHNIFLWSYSGLWRRCDIYYRYSEDNILPLDNLTILDSQNHVTRCTFHPFTRPSKTSNHPPHDELPAATAEPTVMGTTTNPTRTKNEEEYHHPSDFVRAEVSIVVLVLIIMSLAIGFSVFALKYPRYMYKRVAAALHAFTAITLFIIIELVKSGSHPGHATPSNDIFEIPTQYTSGGLKIQLQTYHGYSYLLAWTVLLVFVSVGTAFICMSGKRKNLLQDSDVVLK